MALIKPTLLGVNAFDSSNEQVFSFVANGGDQIVKNRLTIRDNATNTIVYQTIVETFRLEQTLPSGTLSNGVYYNAYVNTYNVLNEISLDSNVIQFYCYAKPTLTFTNIPLDKRIRSASYNFSVEYNQTQDELLDFIKINLYSYSGTIIATSGNLYSTDMPPITFTHTFNALGNNTLYYIGSEGRTVNGTIFESVRESFDVLYENPASYTNLRLENKCKEGYVQINSEYLTNDGVCNVSPTPYRMFFPHGVREDDYIKWGIPYDIDEDVPTTISLWLEKQQLDIRLACDTVMWHQGFYIPKNFIMAIWMNPTCINKFCKLFNNGLFKNGYDINFVREIPFGQVIVKDYFELTGYVNGVKKVYQRSNYVDLMTTRDDIIVWIKKVDDEYELILDVTSKGDTNVINWDDDTYTNVEWNTLTDISWGYEEYVNGDSPVFMNENMDSVFPICNVQLSGGIYDGIDITRNTDKTLTTTFPSWDFDTMINCNFDGNINAGNVEEELKKISGIKIKRREQNKFEWFTLYEKTISDIQDFFFTLNDSFVKHNTTYEWAIVPILNGGVEGDYLTESIKVTHDGTFLSNGSEIYKLYSSVVYGQGNQNIRVGQLQPIGSKYPIVMQNGIVNNFSNTISGNILGYTFEETRVIDRNDVVTQGEDILNFLTSGNAFIVTDWNGNIWLARVTNSPQLSYTNSYGNGIQNISFEFVEQGKYDNQEDMYYNGLVSTL